MLSWFADKATKPNSIMLLTNSVQCSVRAIGMGVITLDVVRRGGTVFQRAGGSCTNILLHLADMGWDCTMCHMDGNDAIAKYMNEDIARGGVKSVSLVHDVPSYVLVINSENGKHSYQRTCEHGSNITACKVVVPALEERLDPNYDVFVFDRAWDIAERFARRTSGMVWFETFKHAFGDSAWKSCVGVSDIVKTADYAVMPDGVNRIVTHGDKGLDYSWKGKSGSMPSVIAPMMVDACGCGDCVSACCIDAVCRGEPLRRGLERGIRLAALNCCYPGPRSMMDSTTKSYREDIMAGNPIVDPPDAVCIGANFDICRCGDHRAWQKSPH